MYILLNLFYLSGTFWLVEFQSIARPYNPGALVSQESVLSNQTLPVTVLLSNSRSVIVYMFVLITNKEQETSITTRMSM